MSPSVILLFLSSFFVVFMLGFQSKNVNGNHYVLAALTSTGIGIVNVYVMRAVASSNSSPWELSAYVAGGPLGIICSMWVHDTFVKPRSHSDQPLQPPKPSEE
jgi:hypothetical protein